MASWMDGAAYAPTERPDGFATPEAEPLSLAVTQEASTPGPVPPPTQLTVAPARPLADLGNPGLRTRDPREPFTPESLALTALGGGSQQRDPRTAFALTTATAMTPGPPPPTGPPLTGPTGAPLPPPSAGQYPPPVATSQQLGASWSAPTAPQVAPAPAAGAASQRTLARVAAGLSLGGFLLSMMAPFLLIAAGILGLRTKRLTGPTGIVVLCIGIAIVLLQLLTGSLGEGNWLYAVAALGSGFAFATGSMRES